MSLRETDLYPPVKAFLESQGYEVKAEIRDCDVVAIRGDEPPVIVELKTSFSLPLLFQGIDRLSLTDSVYMAFALAKKNGKGSLWHRHRRDLLKLSRRLGLGLITIKPHARKGRQIEVHLDPAPYSPRKNPRRKNMLLKEFSCRVGDPNVGGSSGRPIITAYRQDALRCLKYLDQQGEAKLKDIRTQTSVERAAGILQRDYYGWFTRIDRGIYTITPQGKSAVSTFDDALKGL